MLIAVVSYTVVTGQLAGDSHWAREAATHGLLRLASGAGRGVGMGQVIRHSTPAYVVLRRSQRPTPQLHATIMFTRSHFLKEQLLMYES